MNVLSYQIADGIDIRTFKNSFRATVHFSDNDEIFYIIDPDKFIYVFKYGVVSFLNCDEMKISEFMQFITPFCKNFSGFKLSEEFEIETGAKEIRFGFNKIEIINSTIDIFRLIMLNVSQSVALDYYYEVTNTLLIETNLQTQYLEKKGRLNISGRNLKKYIGRTLNLKSNIAENLYIFDSPPETWEDEELNKIDIGLKRTFDLQLRFRSIQESLQIIKDNFELFKDIMQYRNSYALEVIIIILILLEVINLVIEKIK
jgi:required for meiotic nuclear division protein 1